MTLVSTNDLRECLQNGSRGDEHTEEQHHDHEVDPLPDCHVCRLPNRFAAQQGAHETREGRVRLSRSASRRRGWRIGDKEDAWRRGAVDDGEDEELQYA